jgi:hypothetical protein
VHVESPRAFLSSLSFFLVTGAINTRYRLCFLICRVVHRAYLYLTTVSRKVDSRKVADTFSPLFLSQNSPIKNALINNAVGENEEPTSGDDGFDVQNPHRVIRARVHDYHEEL